MPDPEVLSSGGAQEILAILVAALFAALAAVVKVYLSDRGKWDEKYSSHVTEHTKKLEELHKQTLDIALKTQQAILKLGESDEQV